MGGGTALIPGLRKAAELLGKDGGDILILTDGQVSGTELIFAEAESTGLRVHCLGIGSASQDRFLALLARATGGVSRFVTPGRMSGYSGRGFICVHRTSDCCRVEGRCAGPT